MKRFKRPFPTKIPLVCKGVRKSEKNTMHILCTNSLNKKLYTKMSA